MGRQTFYKGHGTGNDFVIIDDQHGMHKLEPQRVAELCDRHTGIGADGLLRVVRARQIDGWDGDPDLWFMDYRNADGSIAEMCGNGLRVFARHLMDEQLVPVGSFDVATRAGLRHVEVDSSGEIITSMGRAAVGAEVTVVHDGVTRPATSVHVGNPHAVVPVLADELEGLDLTTAPTWEPRGAFPEGVNVEFVVVEEPGLLHMRVHERGAGETLSCGTGVVATAAVHRKETGFDGPVRVHVPGGVLTVLFRDDEAWLSGPAAIVARGEYTG